MTDNKLANMLNRIWTKAPALDKNEAPTLFHRSPRMNPVRVIAKAAATVEYSLYSRKALRKDADAADPIDEHELYELLENPCPTFRELDGWTLRYLTFAHFKLVGEFFWLKVRDPRGRIMALLPIPAAWVPRKPTISDHNFLIYPYGVTASSALTVPQEDVVWFKDPDLLDPYSNGRGASEAIFDEIQADEYAAKYQKNFFFNDASPKFAITAEGANADQVKQIKQGFMSKLAGFFHAREPAVLTTKGATIQKLTETMVELDMIESRKYLRDECLQNYQIPPEIYGIIENSNRSTIDSAYYLFNKNVLSYDLAMFERVVTNQLCHEYDDDLCLRHDNIISEDEELALKVYDLALKNGTITANQFNTRFRLPEQKDGDVYVVPMSLMRVPVGGYVSPEPTPQTPPAPKPDDDATLEIEDEPPAKMLKIADDPAIEARKVAIWKSFDAKATSVEEPFRKATRKIADVQNGKIKSAVSSAMRNSATEESINRAIGSVFTDDTDRAVKQTIAPAWRSSLEAGHDQGADTLGLKIASGVTTKASDTVYNEYFNKWIEEHGLEKAKEINETTKDGLLGKLQSVFSSSVADGDGLGAMIDKLTTACDGVYDNMSTTRAELIARTESASTVNAGTFITYFAEGVQKKEWLSVRDGRTRKISEGDEFDHAAMDGKIVDIDKPFVVPGKKADESLMYPGDPNGSAGNVCNDRCSMAPVFDE
jgi:HK97 family phage portal protein